MESTSIPTPTKYQQVVVDVPEDRVAEFHAFFARFLAGPTGRGGRGRYGRPRHGHRGRHGRHCGGRHETAEQHEAAQQGDVASEPAETTEV